MSARFFDAGKMRPRPIWGPPGPFFTWAGKIQKNGPILLIFLGGPMGPIHHVSMSMPCRGHPGYMEDVALLLALGKLDPSNSKVTAAVCSCLEHPDAFVRCTYCPTSGG